MEQNRPFRILSLDGGGIRGVYTARILQRLQEFEPGFLDKMDLFAGTSTGAIIALGLAAGMTTERLVDLYRQAGKDIFARSFLRTATNPGILVKAKYDSANLERLLTVEFEQLCGKIHLSDLGEKRVLIAAFRLDERTVVNSGGKPEPARGWRAKFFHNFPGPGSDADERIVDVALRSSAAPTYFPTSGGFADGGVVANNPSMAAVAQALHQGQRLEDIHLLSVGTGINLKAIKGARLNWGRVDWLLPLLDIMFDGSMLVAHYECRELLGGDRYFRVNEELGDEIELDDYGSVEKLWQRANTVDLEEAIKWVRL